MDTETGAPAAKTGALGDKVIVKDWPQEMSVANAKAKLQSLQDAIQMAEGYIPPAEQATLPTLPPWHCWFRDPNHGLCVRDPRGKEWSTHYTDEPLPENTAALVWEKFESQTGVSENDMTIVGMVRNFFITSALTPADIEGISSKEVWRNSAAALVVKLGDIIDEET